MKRLLSRLAVVLLCASNVASQSPTVPQTDQEKVRAAEQEWLLAYYRLDTGALQASESADFTLLTPSGMVTREAQLNGLRSRASSETLASPPAVFTVTGQSIRVYGNVALVSDKCAVTGGAPRSITSPGTYWQTEVWHNESGKWKIVHIHISLVEHGM